MTQYCPSAWSSTAVPFAIVVAQAHARLDEDAVDLVAHDRNRRHVGEREVVEPAHGRAAESAAGRLGQVVVLGRLVVDRGDPAVRVGAERVLRGRVGVSARIRNRRRDGLDDANVQRLAVRLAQNLVERAVVGGVQRARGAVGGHAGVAGGGVDVTWALRPGRSNIGSRPGLLRHRQRGANHSERQCEHKCKIDSRFHAYPICLRVSLPTSRVLMVCECHASPSKRNAMSIPGPQVSLFICIPNPGTW